MWMEVENTGNQKENLKEWMFEAAIPHYSDLPEDHKNWKEIEILGYVTTPEEAKKLVNRNARKDLFMR